MMIVKFAIDWTARKVLAKSYMLEENGEPVFISRVLSREEIQIDKKLLSKASNQQRKRDKAKRKIRKFKLYFNELLVSLHTCLSQWRAVSYTKSSLFSLVT